MQDFSWHDYLVIVSFGAAIAGVVLVQTEPKTEDNLVLTDRAIFLMIFAYWLVYCLAAIGQKFVNPEWSLVIFSIRATAMFSYLLTTTCLISLPLHRYSASRQAE